jgi:hypothetical protein
MSPLAPSPSLLHASSQDVSYDIAISTCLSRGDSGISSPPHDPPEKREKRGSGPTVRRSGCGGAVTVQYSPVLRSLAKHNISNLRLQRACLYRTVPAKNTRFPSFFLLCFSVNLNSCQSLVPTPHPNNRRYRGDKDERSGSLEYLSARLPENYQRKRAHMLIKREEKRLATSQLPHV